MTTDVQWNSGRWMVVGETEVVWGTNVPEPDKQETCSECGRSTVGARQGWRESGQCSARCWAEAHGEP
jgi:hypothetical protein